MVNKNQNSTKYYSERHEESIAKALNGIRNKASGASPFLKGDVVVKDASLLIEAKTTMTEKQSVSIKRDWIIKNKQEARDTRLSNSCICFNFGPETENYYVIDEKLMRFLVEQLKKENNY